jgi:hypothetical protein
MVAAPSVEAFYMLSGTDIVRILACALMAGFFCVWPVIVSAAVPARYTNENFWTSTHDKPVSFHVSEAGDFYGITETGKLFRQYSIPNILDIRLQRFEIDDAYFYISDRGIIVATDTISALIAYIARA